MTTATLAVQPEKRTYIYPPRATTCIQRADLGILARQGWSSQLKYNDTHILLDYDGPNLIYLWDRHGRHPNYQPTLALANELAAIGNNLTARHGPGRHLLDGGLLHDKHAAIKNTIVIWDMLVLNSKHQLQTTYKQRYEELLELLSGQRIEYRHKAAGAERLGWRLSDNILIPDVYEEREWDTAWGLVERVNASYPTPLLEGLVLRNPNGRLQLGYNQVNNSSWLCRSRVVSGRHRF